MFIILAAISAISSGVGWFGFINNFNSYCIPALSAPNRGRHCRESESVARGLVVGLIPFVGLHPLDAERIEHVALLRCLQQLAGIV